MINTEEDITHQDGTFGKGSPYLHEQINQTQKARNVKFHEMTRSPIKMVTFSDKTGRNQTKQERTETERDRSKLTDGERALMTSSSTSEVARDLFNSTRSRNSETLRLIPGE